MEYQRLRILRLVTLVSLMLSDGTYTVLRRYSRGILQETYSVNEVLLVAEIIKMLFSTCMIARTRTRVTRSGSSGSTEREAADGITGGEYATTTRLSKHLFHLLLQSRKMLVLAATYGLGNSLSYYALARVGAGTFVVIANLKTLTTAGFSRLMLARTYSWARWRALILLVCGVVLFVLPTLEEYSNMRVSTEADAILADHALAVSSGVILGCLAELVVVTLSGFGSIYFEAAIKNDPLDIWERNFQLGLYSILLYLFMIVMYDNPTDGGGGARFFANWTPLAAVLSFLGATGGLLVALSIKYGDSVLKTLAVSGGIIYASVVDRVMLDGPLNGQMSISAIIVIISIINYTFDSTPSEDGTSASTGIVIERSNEKDRLIDTDNKTELEDGWNENEEPRSLINRRS